jgi:hypothetical protein
MAICFGGKKSKASQTITKRLSSDKHNDLDHQHTLNNHHRSHSHLNHQKKPSNMPHDLSRSSANSASSSALSYSNSTPQSTASSSNNTVNNNHYYHKNSKKHDKMDISDDDDDDDDDDIKDKEDDESTTDDDSKQQKKLKRTLDNLTSAQQKFSIVNADMIFYCFEILGNHLFNGKHHLGKHHVSSSSTTGQLIPSTVAPPAIPADPYPLFVTWFIGTDKQLRGCIGTFSPMNLAQGITTIVLRIVKDEGEIVCLGDLP